MYYPIMRGKQYELIALRDLAPILSPKYFKPIIEPVRNNLSPLIKTIEILNKHKIVPIVIINPNLGDFSDTPEILTEKLFKNDLDINITFIPCIKVMGQADEYKKIISDTSIEKAVYIYDGLNKDKMQLLSMHNVAYAIINKDSPDAAKNQLNNINVILMDDPFQKEKKNADYGSKSFFSDLHVSYKDLRYAKGFGDYTIVGDSFSETGGPAYVVTIHLSYIDGDEFDSMYIKHFSSEDDGTPTNPGGKFKQALNKIIHLVDKKPEMFYETIGINELKLLYTDDHFPGLGIIKKVSMIHHIQTICNYLEEHSDDQ